ncbi:MAG: BACON domain-containing protein [Alistipes sp.]|nr:BACON domain-containing protein [Alistipes sp.]
MKKIFSILFLAALVMVACEKGNEEAAKPTITITSGDVVEFGGEGGQKEITFTLANSNDTKVNISESATWLDAKQEGNVIKLTAKANDTNEAREAEVTLRYSTDTKKVTVKQSASEYDVVFEAKRFEGIYFGTEYSSNHNYYIILSDVGVKTDASARANGTYYYFDMYRNIKADEMNPILPDGEYTFDATNSFADKTFSDESSWYAVTGADGKVAKSASYKEATVVVKNGKFTANIVMENGETHFVTYEGNLVATTYFSTFADDVEFAVEGAEVTATCYGDTYEKGQQTWFIEAVKGDDYFCVEILAPSAEKFDGIYQVLPSTGVSDYANKFIPGLLGSDGLVGTWYAKLTDGTIKGDVMAPMVEGMIQIVTEGDVVTINYSCKDDVGNDITGSVKGV